MEPVISGAAHTRAIRAPRELAESPNQSELKLKGLSVIETCTHTEGKQGSMFLEDHLILCVLRGSYAVRHGNRSYTVRRNEMVLLKKAIVIEYEKTGEPDDGHMLEYMMFFLKDELLNDFVKMAKIASAQPAEPEPVSILPMNRRLLAYVESLRPYFHDRDGIEDGLVRLKLLELLFDLAHADESAMKQLLQMKQQARSTIAAVVEENVMNPVSLNDLAYLSGRSLSSFKREFQTIYNLPPSQWIRGKRLDKARELLLFSSLSVTDVCYATGFENVAHFSRVFKERFGESPSSYRKQSS
ncbi:helix-turn-helix transcriptional regulator [Paenibacillus glycinis]|uniref:Helix-turn-helix domain-containing protein n=1 Tax=Paenibacillus glycinis TaxID=2697035 RepID=A0ABW9XXK8_9BACL|nr:AraC family transcriptional regulator [Paenibacillus glycinis]NBD27440.1 helix-turn-helix domain-containing protein [Paenibacillus glycinis]